ncbi:ATP-dependent DNA ligase [Methyloprofundus sedimenti]|uniref:ATP-dependent DNA ligase n=1 Tax=Methyloprofundus sedimenti TaxID=1420851 RepID=A0A1V8M3J8_9GAMM|nr:ATP-dependent DNA ligase [Methyloprofundus sedimenti]
MIQLIYPYSAFFVSILLASSPALAIEKPKLMLARTFQPSVVITDYWVSEKLDGVRARWNGHQLISRGGIALAAPNWFIDGFPDMPLDGELWMARGEYQQTVSIIKKQKPHSGWKKIKFMIFDLPDHQGSFSNRLAVMRNIDEQIQTPYLSIIPQYQLSTNEELMHHLKIITNKGGEGIMLHHKTGIYRSGRSNDLLKLKLFTDAEASVIGYRAGKGQFAGKMGAIKVRSSTGKIFFIGSGFSHKDRERPPAIGSTISFRYQGFTDSGIPRFAVFIRVRNEP